MWPWRPRCLGTCCVALPIDKETKNHPEGTELMPSLFTQTQGRVHNLSVPFYFNSITPLRKEWSGKPQKLACEREVCSRKGVQQWIQPTALLLSLLVRAVLGRCWSELELMERWSLTSTAFSVQCVKRQRLNPARNWSLNITANEVNGGGICFQSAIVPCQNCRLSSS